MALKIDQTYIYVAEIDVTTDLIFPSQIVNENKLLCLLV